MYLSVGEIWLNRRRFFVGVAHDLTKLKRAEERLLMLSAAIDQSPSAILITDKEGHVEYVNPRVAQLTGYDPDELIGQNLPLWSHDTANDQHHLLWETLKAGLEWRGEILGRTKSGDLYWTLETVSPLRNSEGKITHYMAIQQDITAQKRNKEGVQHDTQDEDCPKDQTGDGDCVFDHLACSSGQGPTIETRDERTRFRRDLDGREGADGSQHARRGDAAEAGAGP